MIRKLIATTKVEYIYIVPVSKDADFALCDILQIVHRDVNHSNGLVQGWVTLLLF